MRNQKHVDNLKEDLIEVDFTINELFKDGIKISTETREDEVAIKFHGSMWFAHYELERLCKLKNYRFYIAADINPAIIFVKGF